MAELFAGVDLGGTGIKAVIGTSTGQIVAKGHAPTLSHEGPAAVLQRIAQLVEQLAQQASGRPVAVGMGVPGLVDVAAGVTKFLPNMPSHWREVPAAQTLTDLLKCPVKILNDARAATLGELKFGRGRDCPNLTFAFFGIGTGIGGGVVIDGKLRLGPLGAAGELGHQTVMPDGPLCGCGNHGCLETLASGPAIAFEGQRLMRIGLAPRLHEFVNGHTEAVSTREMIAAAEAGDEAIRDAILRAATYLGIGIANVAIALHPELIVIGGGVAEMGALLFDRVREVVRQRIRMFPADTVAIEPSLLGERAGELGALALAAQ